MELYRIVEGSGSRVVLVHGFTQTHVSWHEVASDLARDHEVVAVDAPGHGQSSLVCASLSQAAALLGEAGGRAVYVGYSMGARMALRLAIDRPDLVRGLVMVGGTAGIADAAERAGRRCSDEALGDRIEADGVRKFLAEWMNQPMFSWLAHDPADQAARHRNTAAGLASSLRLAGTGTMDPPWWDQLSTITAPTLVLAGRRDQKFTALGKQLAERIGPEATFAAIEGAGHAAHLEQPRVFIETLRQFLASNDTDPAPSVDGPASE